MSIKASEDCSVLKQSNRFNSLHSDAASFKFQKPYIFGTNLSLHEKAASELECSREFIDWYQMPLAFLEERGSPSHHLKELAQLTDSDHNTGHTSEHFCSEANHSLQTASERSDFNQQWKNVYENCASSITNDRSSSAEEPWTSSFKPWSDGFPSQRTINPNQKRVYANLEPSIHSKPSHCSLKPVTSAVDGSLDRTLMETLAYETDCPHQICDNSWACNDSNSSLSATQTVSDVQDDTSAGGFRNELEGNKVDIDSKGLLLTPHSYSLHWDDGNEQTDGLFFSLPTTASDGQSCDSIDESDDTSYLRYCMNGDGLGDPSGTASAHYQGDNTRRTVNAANSSNIALGESTYTKWPESVEYSVHNPNCDIEKEAKPELWSNRTHETAIQIFSASQNEPTQFNQGPDDTFPLLLACRDTPAQRVDFNREGDAIPPLGSAGTTPTEIYVQYSTTNVNHSSKNSSAAQYVTPNDRLNNFLTFMNNTEQSLPCQTNAKERWDSNVDANVVKLARDPIDTTNFSNFNRSYSLELPVTHRRRHLTIEHQHTTKTSDLPSKLASDNNNVCLSRTSSLGLASPGMSGAIAALDRNKQLLGSHVPLANYEAIKLDSSCKLADDTLKQNVSSIFSSATSNIQHSVVHEGESSYVLPASHCSNYPGKPTYDAENHFVLDNPYYVSQGQLFDHPTRRRTSAMRSIGQDTNVMLVSASNDSHAFDSHDDSRSSPSHSSRRKLIRPSRISCYQLRQIMPIVIRQFETSAASRKGLCRQLTGQLYPNSPKPSPNFLLNTLLPVFRAADYLGFNWAFHLTSSLSYLRLWVCSQRGGKELIQRFRVEYNAPTGKDYRPRNHSCM